MNALKPPYKPNERLSKETTWEQEASTEKQDWKQREELKANG
jgi:hypothetical protein